MKRECVYRRQRNPKGMWLSNYMVLGWLLGGRARGMDGWKDGLGHFRMGEGSFNLNHEATVLQRDQSHNGIKAMAHCKQDTRAGSGACLTE